MFGDVILVSAATTIAQVKDLQQAFKHAVLIRVARKMVELALAAGEFWPDEYSIAEIAQRDKNCVGSAYNWLRGAKIIARHPTENRPSKASGANGRTIFKWVLCDRSLAETFLRRNPEVNEPVATVQTEFL